MVAFKYLGGSDFSIEIFNCYAVEIDYGLNKIAFENGVCVKNHVGSIVDEFRKISDVEIDKHCATLSFNAHSSLSAKYELLIRQTHLQTKDYCEVFSIEACGQLGLIAILKWIHLGFKKIFWYIKVKWENGHLLFDKEWFSFAKASGLTAGDICIFLATSQGHRFKIAVFEKHSIATFYHGGGIADGKGMMKFYKAMKSETVKSGVLEVPRVFVNEFGWMVAGEIRLMVGDGREFPAYFCGKHHIMKGLKSFFKAYSVEEGYIIFFDYIGRSTFYVTIYNDLGMDMFNHMERKLMLKDVEQIFEEEVIVLSDCSFQDNCGYNAMDIEHNAGLTHDIGQNNFEGGHCINYFTAVLKKSNIDQTGHGVYFARHLLPIFRTWKNSTIVNLVHDQQTWKVAIHRRKKVCRFGRGWDKFTKDNTLKEGQKIRFTHVNEYTFAVEDLV